MVRIKQSDPESYYIEKQDPYPYQSDKQDTDPYQKGLDLQHCINDGNDIFFSWS